MRDEHDVVPQFGGKRAARHLPHPRVVVVADPDAGHIVCGVADEPGIARVLGGAGLAACRMPGNGGALARAARRTAALIMSFMAAT